MCLILGIQYCYRALTMFINCSIVHHVYHVHHVPLRVWLILGILYYYRALTMFITVLPKPDETYICAPKVFIFSITKGS